jgi:hypothetical protein
MRAVVSLPQMVRLLPLPLLSSLKAVEWRWRERGQVTHRRLDEQRQVETALRGRQAHSAVMSSRVGEPKTTHNLGTVVRH